MYDVEHNAMRVIGH